MHQHADTYVSCRDGNESTGSRRQLQMVCDHGEHAKALLRVEPRSWQSRCILNHTKMMKAII